MLLVGVTVLGWASGLYMKAHLGAGPRDSFVLAVIRWTGRRVGVARFAIEGTVFAIGAILDPHHIGIGTVVYTLGVGPMVDWSFRVLRVQTARHHAAAPPAPAGEGQVADPAL